MKGGETRMDEDRKRERGERERDNTKMMKGGEIDDREK